MGGHPVITDSTNTEYAANSYVTSTNYISVKKKPIYIQLNNRHEMAACDVGCTHFGTSMMDGIDDGSLAVIVTRH